MDTISRENTSMLPVAAIIVGVIGLLLGGYSAITVLKVNRTLAEYQAKIDKIDSVESQVGSAATQAAQASKDVQALTRSTQNAFNDIGPLLGNLQASVTKLEEGAKKPATVARRSSETAVAADGEYVVKTGDNGMKIAAAHGATIGELQAVNPGVNWNALKIGQKLKLPKK